MSQPPGQFPTELDASRLARWCRPGTVIDVGVGFGTHQLYEAFPSAKFVLIEPLREYESAIAGIAQRYPCTVHYLGLSRNEGVRDIHVDLENLQMSSVQPRTPLTRTGHRMQVRQVPVTTLDSLFPEPGDLDHPVLLKIDTEGHELDVLQGGTRLLRTTATVIAEVSVAGRFEGGYRFEDLILFMNEHGFRVRDFLTMVYAPGELTPRYTDILFSKA